MSVRIHKWRATYLAWHMYFSLSPAADLRAYHLPEAPRNYRSPPPCCVVPVPTVLITTLNGDLTRGYQRNSSSGGLLCFPLVPPRPPSVFPITVDGWTNRNSNAYFNLVSFSILFYDYFLVLDWEISRYWGSQFTWVNALFFANRYGTLLGNIPVVMEYFWSQNSTPTKIKASFESLCLGLESYHQYFIVASQIMIGVRDIAMLILRTYALYERSKRVLTLMVTVTVAAVAWSILTGKAVDKSTNLPLYFGCNYPTSREQGLSLAAAWAGVAVFDCMIFLLTLYKVFSRRRPNGTDLLTVLLRDGSVYFGVMVMSNVSNILTFVLGTSYTRGIATTFTNIISSIMITRLMLNIRDPALAHMSGRLTQTTTLQTGNIRFAGWMGATTAPELDTEAVMDIELSERGTAAGPSESAAAGMA
ncbi:hypothetical protein C8R47DRAFT_1200993 [Mycena vitilis]|nr:hypothetical protein C8R47DRAFT_1200993 [Mycena vitilis]